MEESSETGAISAEIESQNGENDCECFDGGAGRAGAEVRGDEEGRGGRGRKEECIPGVKYGAGTKCCQGGALA
ncbi:hypothetical protein KM043_006008 [Ampulex compressa]|nr:hypothetical protein KM043_006008 [Ampulex compressa]